MPCLRDRRGGLKRSHPYEDVVEHRTGRGRDERGAGELMEPVLGNAYAGVAGANGWLAADLADAGFTGLPDMLTETFGRISGSGLDAQVALDRLGARFEITRNYFKRYACCRYNHAAIQALAARVNVLEDPALTARLPAERPARVEVRLSGGVTRSRRVDTTAGDFDRPYPREALRQKFLALATPTLGQRGAARGWSLCEGLDVLKDARELGDALRALEERR